MNSVICDDQVVDAATGTPLQFVLQEKTIGPGVFSVCLVPRAADCGLTEAEASDFCVYYDPDKSTEPVHAISMQIDLVNRFSELDLIDTVWSYRVILLGSSFAVHIVFGDHASMEACGLPEVEDLPDESSD